MLTALEIWIGLSLLTGLLWGIFLSGWGAYWHDVRHIFAPSNVSEHSDLSEGR